MELQKRLTKTSRGPIPRQTFQPNKTMKNVQENKAEVERLTDLIEEHCLCMKLVHVSGNHFEVYPSEGFQPGRSNNSSKRLSLIDLAMYLEKLWIHSGIKPLAEKIEMVKAYRNANNLRA